MALGEAFEVWIGALKILRMIQVRVFLTIETRQMFGDQRFAALRITWSY